MLDELRRGENVQNRRLATWLTEDEYESFESDWESQQQIREELRDKPDELRRYENKLHQATFNNNEAERFRKKGNKDKATELRNLSNTQCEEASEILQEIVDADASLQMWFDRGLDFGHGYFMVNYSKALISVAGRPITNQDALALQRDQLVQSLHSSNSR